MGRVEWSVWCLCWGYGGSSACIVEWDGTARACVVLVAWLSLMRMVLGFRLRVSMVCWVGGLYGAVCLLVGGLGSGAGMGASVSVSVSTNVGMGRSGSVSVGASLSPSPSAKGVATEEKTDGC
jgi:hypothetical protein